MYSLILKDYLMLKRMILLITCVIAFFHILQNPPTLAISMAGIFFISSVGSFEDRSNSHIMLNSLPLNRKNIISSKYVGALIFGVFAVMMSVIFQAVFYFVFHIYDHPFPEVKHLFIGMLCILLFTSIYFPILYKFGEKYTRIVTMFLVIAIIAFGQIMMYLLKDQVLEIQQFLSQFTVNQLIFAGGLIIAIIYLVSWFCTIKIYEAKDF
ncbi:ABC-2 transporter permease [Cytobacillus dafuensis]|uniref:ABC-2 transporter permease n=1 Tax=Cytobacillus dafuensis TaxID=1742359 RepID=A0A5B8Z7A9_CYTDA|nr:ABC-2 transporter permease [Cytobacillus dafuensis]QED48771.1 ABC-2 transporter permease [Cytobacillus dafuensis]